MNRYVNSQPNRSCIQNKETSYDIIIVIKEVPMTLNVNKEKLTILDVQFDNYEDFDAVWYAVGSSMIEDFTPTTESVLELKIYVTNRRKELQIG